LVQRGSDWVEVTDVPILTAECLWHVYQKEAEEIVACRRRADGRQAIR
jgi:hypothetical protein